MHLHPNIPSLLASLPAQNLDPAEKLEWWFRFRATDTRQSFRFTKAIANLFPFQVSSGDTAPGGAASTVIVSIVLDGPISPRKATKTLTDATPIALQHGLEFLGVGCRRRAIDWSSIKWLTLDDAKWRLRHFADTGNTGQLAKGQAGSTDLLFAFSGEGDTLPTLDHNLSSRGLRTKSITPTLLLARITANSTDADLTSHFTQMQQSAAAAGAQLKGVDLWAPDADW